MPMRCFCVSAPSGGKPQSQATSNEPPPADEPSTKDLITKNIINFLDHLDPSLILDDLARSKVIDSTIQVELIDQQQTSSRRVAAKCLVQHLLKCSEDQCRAFVRCVESCAAFKDLVQSMRSSDACKPRTEDSSKPQSHQGFTAMPSKMIMHEPLWNQASCGIDLRKTSVC